MTLVVFIYQWPIKVDLLNNGLCSKYLTLDNHKLDLKVVIHFSVDKYT